MINLRKDKRGFGFILWILLVVFIILCLWAIIKIVIIGSAGYWDEFMGYGFVKAIIGFFKAIGNFFNWVFGN